MREYAVDLWQRALTALATARADSERGDQDAAASRAYYAAFYAVSAVLALRGEHFKTHDGVERALHQMVRAGNWPVSVGPVYHSVRTLRNTGDYGGLQHVTADQAGGAIDDVEKLIETLRKMSPGLSEPAT